MNLQVHPEFEPQFKIADRAWVVLGQHIQDTRVLSIVFKLMVFHGFSEPVAVCTKYQLDTFDTDTADGLFFPGEVYRSEAEARELAQWHSAEGISEEEWVKAVGDRANETLDECELFPCCAQVSNIRDLLLKCKRDRGLNERDVRVLKELFKGHEYPMPDGQRPFNLDKIIAKLGFLGEIQG